MRVSRIAVLMLALAVQPVQSWAKGDAPDNFEPKEISNPPPTAALNSFDRFEIVPFAMGAPYAGEEVNEDARQRLQVNLDERVPPLLTEWNAKEAKSSPPKTLKIEPAVTHVKFISGKARFWKGAFAGGTAVLVTVKLSDAATGEVIAEPQFYQHANAMGAAWSYGATDKAMLVRTTDLISEYLKANYAAAVGGPTGKDADDDKAKDKDQSESKESADQQSTQ
ncbi:hypothetical protein GCM10011487_36810 [Steroidobacter agaridevorans]|uniref:DUF4410 domain-containing protein n=1 Tax=Steroidobacter agaridevorans TaxID=2695856 RepID=A0A829YFV6_9GAMM|nr:hypothetical protein [Steroidobacter agaridevorans]GFE81681.1 hypothetical protein GCM10011487_36810 [Steroidobacter agaridevorans]